MHKFSRISSFLVVTAFFLALTGCKPSMLPSTSVKDNYENRTVMHFFGEYLKALEQRSVPALMALAAEDYFEDSGTPDGADDYGYNQLQDKLEKTFARTKDLRLYTFVQKIIPKNNTYEIIYYYKQNALMEFPAGDQWMMISEVNRLTIRKKSSRLEDGFEIINGL